MKRIIAYLAIAVFLGILLTLIPLFILAEPKSLDIQMMSSRMVEQLHGLESYANLQRAVNPIDVIAMLSISLIIAFVWYIFLKHKIFF